MNRDRYDLPPTPVQTAYRARVMRAAHRTSARPGHQTYFNRPACFEVWIANQERSCVIDAVRIDTNISNKMRRYRRDRSVLPYTHSIADRTTAFERAALLQAFQVRLPGAVADTSDVIVHEQYVFGHTNLPEPGPGRTRGKRILHQLRQSQ